MDCRSSCRTTRRSRDGAASTARRTGTVSVDRAPSVAFCCGKADAKPRAKERMVRHDRPLSAHAYYGGTEKRELVGKLRFCHASVAGKAHSGAFVRISNYT